MNRLLHCSAILICSALCTFALAAPISPATTPLSPRPSAMPHAGASAAWTAHAAEVAQFNRWLFIGTIASKSGFSWNVIAVRNALTPKTARTLVMVSQPDNPENMYVWEETAGVGRGYNKQKPGWSAGSEEDFWNAMIGMPWTNDQIYKSLFSYHRAQDVTSWSSTGWPQAAVEGPPTDRRTVVHFYDHGPDPKTHNSAPVIAFTTSAQYAKGVWGDKDISVAMVAIAGFTPTDTDEDGITNIDQWRGKLDAPTPSQTL